MQNILAVHGRKWLAFRKRRERFNVIIAGRLSRTVQNEQHKIPFFQNAVSKAWKSASLSPEILGTNDTPMQSPIQTKKF
jgi:hypothetical protein